MNRPFITPDNLRDFTSYESVRKRYDERLAGDISRAELYAMDFCGQDFSDIQEGSLPAERLVLAVTLIAEMYAFNAELKANAANDSGGGPFVRSESSQDYSCSYSNSKDDLISIEDLDIPGLLGHLRSGAWGDIEICATVL